MCLLGRIWVLIRGNLCGNLSKASKKSESGECLDCELGDFNGQDASWTHEESNADSEISFVNIPYKTANEPVRYEYIQIEINGAEQRANVLPQNTIFYREVVSPFVKGIGDRSCSTQIVQKREDNLSHRSNIDCEYIKTVPTVFNGWEYFSQPSGKEISENNDNFFIRPLKESIGDSSECSEIESNEDVDYEIESSIDVLPVEILHYIFSFLSLPELCTNVGLVCKQWHSLINDPIHWKRLVFNSGLPSASVNLCLKKAPYLKELTFHWRTDLILFEVLNAAVNCRLLQKLCLPYCDNVDKNVIKIISDNCFNLMLLDLEGCRLVNNECIPLISKLTKLKSLYLSHCALIETQGIELLSQNLPHIEELNTDGIPDISNSAIDVLVRYHSPHLRMLCLDGAALTDGAFRELPRCRQLSTLCVSFGERFSDCTLTHVKEIKSLQTLRLCKGGEFTSDGLVSLFANRSLANLVNLDLSDCLQLQDNGIHALVHCCGANLKQLYLCWCWNISDIGLKDIIGYCSKLEVLDLMGLCDVGGNSLVLIPVAIPNLQVLDLRQCHQVTDELLVDVVQQLPNLVVFNYYGEKISFCPRTGQRRHRFHSCIVTR